MTVPTFEELRGRANLPTFEQIRRAGTVPVQPEAGLIPSVDVGSMVQGLPSVAGMEMASQGTTGIGSLYQQARQATDQPQLVAGSPLTLLDRAKQAIRERTGFFEPPIYSGPRERMEQPIRTLAGAGAYVTADYLNGLGLNIPDIVTSRIAPGQGLADVVNKLTGFTPTDKEVSMGETAEFMGGISTSGRIAKPLIEKIAARKAFKTMLTSGLTWGTSNATQEIADKIVRNDPINLEGIYYTAGVGTLFGAGEAGVEAFSKFVRNVRTGTAIEAVPKGAQAVDARAAARKEVNDALLNYRKTGDRTEWDRVRAKYTGAPVPGETAAETPKPAAAPAVEGEFPLATTKPVDIPALRARLEVQGRPAQPLSPVVPAAQQAVEPAPGEVVPAPAAQEVAGKEPWEMSDLADTPNIPEERIEAKKREDGKWQLFYRGTRNEVFSGEVFGSSKEAKDFFRVQKAKAQGAGAAPESPSTVAEVLALHGERSGKPAPRGADRLTPEQMTQYEKEFQELKKRALKQDGTPRKNADPADVKRLEELHAIAQEELPRRRRDEQAYTSQIQDQLSDDLLSVLGLRKGQEVTVTGPAGQEKGEVRSAEPLGLGNDQIRVQVKMNKGGTYGWDPAHIAEAKPGTPRSQGAATPPTVKESLTVPPSLAPAAAQAEGKQAQPPAPAEIVPPAKPGEAVGATVQPSSAERKGEVKKPTPPQWISRVKLNESFAQSNPRELSDGGSAYTEYRLRKYDGQKDRPFVGKAMVGKDTLILEKRRVATAENGTKSVGEWTPWSFGDTKQQVVVSVQTDADFQTAMQEAYNKVSPPAPTAATTTEAQATGAPGPGTSGMRPGFAGLGAPKGMAGANVPPITIDSQDLREPLPEVTGKEYPKDLGPLAEQLTLSNQAQNSKNPVVIAAAQELVDTPIVMREKTQRWIMEAREQYNKLPKDYRADKGGKFFELMDRELSPDQIDAATDIPGDVKPILKYFKKMDEDIRLAIIQQKRGMAQAMHAHETSPQLVDHAKEKGLNWETRTRNIGGLTIQSVYDLDKDAFLNKQEAVSALAQIDIPDTWGRQWSHIQHVFFGQYNLKVVKRGVDESGKPTAETQFIGSAETQGEAVDKLLSWAERARADGQDLKGVQLTFDRDMNIPYDVARMSTAQVHHLRNALKDALDAERGEVEDAMRGIIGKQASKRKFWGAMLYRKGAEGYSTDFMRVWETSLSQYVRWKHLSEMNAKVTPMIEQLRAEGLPKWADHLKFHVDNLMGRKRSTATKWMDDRLSRLPGVKWYVKPYALDRWSAALKSVNYIRHLQTPRFYFVNSLQPIQTLWPVVGERQFFRAVKLYYTKEGQDIIHRYGVETEGKFRETGIIAPKRTKGWSPAALSERRNQGIAFLGLYDQGIKMGMSEAEAARYGRLRGQVFTQFAYSPSDVPKIMMGNLGGLAFQYRRFTVKNLELVSRLLREGNYGGVARWLTALVGVGGASVFLRVATGLPMVGYLTYEAYKWVKDHAGKDAADVIHHGLPALLNIDMSGSVTPVDMPYGETLAEKAGNAILGPTGTTIQRLVSDLQNTDVSRDTGTVSRTLRSLIDSSPTVKQFEYLIKALRRDTSNFDARQRENYKLEVSDLWKKALAFTPETESIQRMQQAAMLKLKEEYDKQLDKVALARIGGDDEQAAKLVVEWNAFFPESPITLEDSNQRVKARSEAAGQPRVERTYESLPARLKAAFPEMIANYTDDDLISKIAENTYITPTAGPEGQILQPGDAHPGQESLVKLWKDEYARRTGKPPESIQIRRAQMELSKQRMQKELSKWLKVQERSKAGQAK